MAGAASRTKKQKYDKIRHPVIGISNGVASAGYQSDYVFDCTILKYPQAATRRMGERTSGGTGPSMDKVSPNLTLPCRRNNKRLAQVSEPFWLSLKSKRNLASTDPETGRQENQTARLAQKSRLARQHSAGSRNQTRPKLRRPQERRPVEGILVVL